LAFAIVRRPFAGLQKGFATLQNAFAGLQKGFATLQNVFADGVRLGAELRRAPSGRPTSLQFCEELRHIGYQSSQFCSIGYQNCNCSLSKSSTLSRSEIALRKFAPSLMQFSPFMCSFGVLGNKKIKC